VVFAIVAAVLLVRFRVNATWLLVGGAAAGWLVRRFAAW
jgi:chromate transporter